LFVLGSVGEEEKKGRGDKCNTRWMRGEREEISGK